MRNYNKLKKIYSEFTNDDYEYTKELDDKIKIKVLEALKLVPKQAIARLSEILEQEKQGNKLF